jgi:hypothetical protein
MSFKFSIFPALALLALPMLALGQKTAPTSVGSGTTARWTFTTGPVTMKSGPKGAGRIISLQYNGSEVLNMDTGTATNYGSTFWPSPQAAWASNWPPAANIDGSGAYTATEIDSTLVLRGQTDPNNNVRINKQYWANAADTSFSLRFTLINTGTAAKAWAPWQDTRIPAGGLYLFPRGVDTVSGQLKNLTRDTLGYRWFKYDSATVLTSGTNKFYSDGSLGWYAHLNKNRVLFIKKFTDTPYGKKAPGVEKEIELYTTNDKRFVEMEAQGSYDTIPAGDSIIWNMKWYVRKMPDSTNVAVGNMNVVNFINQVLSNIVSVRDAARSQGAFRGAVPGIRVAGSIVTLYVPVDAVLSLSVVNARGETLRSLHSGPVTAGSRVFRLTGLPRGAHRLVLKNASGEVLASRAVPVF